MRGDDMANARVHRLCARLACCLLAFRPPHAVCPRAASHYEERGCDRRVTVLATPMTAAPLTVPRILTVPRDRTEDSATHGEISACRDVILAEM